MKNEQDKVNKLIDRCMDKCPQPYYAKCAMFTQYPEVIEEDCKKPYDDMHITYVEMAYVGDKDISKVFPLVKTCADACKGDKPAYDVCVVFEGIDEITDFEAFQIDFRDYGLAGDYEKLSDKCEDALDELYTVEDEFLIRQKELSVEDSTELAKLSEACSNVCPDSKLLCALITESGYWHSDAPTLVPYKSYYSYLA